SGTAPLEVTMVPVTSAGATAWLWTLSDGGMPQTSSAASPQATWPMPGSYDVRLTVGFGLNAHATAVARIDVPSAPTGGACAVDAQCGAGAACRCAHSADGGQVCPADLSTGLCTRACTGGSCSRDQVCADLSRSSSLAPEVSKEPCRRPICLPTCTTNQD